MNKQVKKIVVALAALIVILAAVLILINLPQPEEGSQGSGVELLNVVSLVAGDVDYVRVVNEKGSYRIHQDPDSLNFVLDNDAALPADGIVLERAFSELTHQFATTVVVENLDNLAEYGLDEPAASITAFLKDGGSYTYYVGDRSPATGACYAYVDGEEKVYLMSSTSGYSLNYSTADFMTISVTKALTSENISSLSEFSFSGSGRSDVFAARRKTDADSETTGVLSSYVVTSPYSADVSEDRLTDSLLEPYAEMIPTTAAIVRPADGDLTRLQLTGDTAYLVLSITLDGEKTEYYVGAQNADGYRYFYTEGYDVVYLIEQSKVDFIANSSFNMLNRMLYLRYIYEQDEIAVAADGVEAVYKVTGSDDDGDLAAIVDGKEVDIDDFRQFYQAAIGCFIQGEATGSGNEPLYLSLRFSRRNGMVDTLNFYTLDERKCLIEYNGRALFYCTKESVDAILQWHETLTA